MGQRDRIHTNVEQCTAAQRGVERTLLRVQLGAITEIGQYQPDVADLALFNASLHLLNMGQKARPHCLHKKAAMCPRAIDHFLHFAAVHGKRLFTQHGLPRAQTGYRVLLVQRVRRGNIDNIHVGIGGQRVVSRVAIGYIEPLPERVSGRLRPRTHGDDFGIFLRAESGCKVTCNAARPQNSPADLFHFPCSQTVNAAG